MEAISPSYDFQTIENSCNICLNVIDDQYIITKCNHFFCKSCIKEWMVREYTLYMKTTCPTCRTSLHELYGDVTQKRMFWSNVRIMLKFIVMLFICSVMIYLMALSIFFTIKYIILYHYQSISLYYIIFSISLYFILHCFFPLNFDLEEQVLPEF